MITDPVAPCPDYDNDNAVLDFVGINFVPINDFDFVMNGTIYVRQDIEGKIPVNCSGKKIFYIHFFRCKTD